jgi:hypothetical protein
MPTPCAHPIGKSKLPSLILSIQLSFKIRAAAQLVRIHHIAPTTAALANATEPPHARKPSSWDARKIARLN